MTRTHLLACHECDLLQFDVALPEGGVLRCRRCHGELYRNRANSLNRAFALSLGAAVLLLIANSYPIVGLSVSGTSEVLIIGLLVALIKLAYVASVVVGVGLWSFDSRLIWDAARQDHDGTRKTF